jgi:hypothetical protein
VTSSKRVKWTDLLALREEMKNVLEVSINIIEDRELILVLYKM